jgi:hypothetical protein
LWRSRMPSVADQRMKPNGGGPADFFDDVRSNTSAATPASRRKAKPTRLFRPRSSVIIRGPGREWLSAKMPVLGLVPLVLSTTSRATTAGRSPSRIFRLPAFFGSGIEPKGV